MAPMGDWTTTLTVGGAGAILVGVIRLGLAIFRSRTKKAQWNGAESSVRHARRRISRLWVDVRGMPGNRDDVLAELGKTNSALKQLENTLVAARRTCEDIDRKREHQGITAPASRLDGIWELIEKNLEPGDEDAGHSE